MMHCYTVHSTFTAFYAKMNIEFFEPGLCDKTRRKVKLSKKVKDTFPQIKTKNGLVPATFFQGFVICTLSII